MIDLKLFQRPQRYIGNEWNVIKKPHHNRIPICISYPDVYEVGMSNLGIRIIYSALNEFDDVACERVFLPGQDLAHFLSSNKLKLFSLETKTDLDKFEIFGFNFNCETNFVNFLHMLSLSGVPLKACQRKDMIVFGGGIANPEPIAEFVDLFFLGEFEDSVGAFVEVLRKYKDKKSRLEALSEIEGFYVPSFYSSEIRNNQYEFTKVYTHAQLPIKRAHVADLNKSYYPLKWVTPHTAIVHDRVPVEIARGCPNQCTFCQARAIYCPYREKKVSRIVTTIKEIYKNSGYENFSLLSLSASDYSSIEELVDVLIEDFRPKRIGLSLPSLRIDDILGNVQPKLYLLKKTSLTVAVETASDDLRVRLGKRIDINKLFEAAKIIRSLNLRHIKIYFMFGFPGESEEDLLAIGSFLGRLNRETGLAINASINIFMPKPFSLWQAVAMDEEETLVKKVQIISSNISRRGNIKLSITPIKKSILETVLSRADRKFSSVILNVFNARRESFNLDFEWQEWERAMQEEGVDYRVYLKPQTINFPWSLIDTN